ncbi:hypothetical protein [Streptomyces rhizosphaericus]|uniref:AMP-binding enzyme C-terminal domain-containing protein n=1 Tax=Streptomyces rhizosphaericus TaxID=114699 RepID=A0ABN1NW94_9ACTN|nr:hypothetical protein [Streptomyces rhizosphaericus]
MTIQAATDRRTPQLRDPAAPGDRPQLSPGRRRTARRRSGFSCPATRPTEALPKNPSGKILKRELREIYRDMAEEPPDDRGAHI